MLNKLARSIAHTIMFYDKVNAWCSKNILLVCGIFLSCGLIALNHIPGNIETSATFISANGTTQTGWQIGGGGGATVTGTTGNLGYVAASGKGFSFSGNTGSTITTSAGAMTVSNSGVGNTIVDNSGGGSVNIAPSTSDPIINVGDQSDTAANTINIGPGDLSTSNNNFINIDAENQLNIVSPFFVLEGSAGDKLSLNNGGTVVSSAQVTFTAAGATAEFQMFAHGTPVGEVLLYSGAPLEISESLLENPSALACGTGGTQTVGAGVPLLVVSSGTLTSNCIIDFGTNGTNQVTDLDMSGVTLGATFGVQFKNGTATKTYISTTVISGTAARVVTHGANTLAVSF